MWPRTKPYKESGEIFGTWQVSEILGTYKESGEIQDSIEIFKDLKVIFPFYKKT